MVGGGKGGGEVGRVRGEGGNLSELWRTSK